MTYSPESLASTASPDVIKLVAPLLFGSIFNWALYGALCVQIYVYGYNFPNDSRSVKSLAYFVFLLETVQTILNGTDVYHWFIAGFGNVEQLAHSHFAPIDIALMTGVTSFIVQEYFCYRIWVLNNKRLSWMCWIIAVSSMTQSVAVTWLGIKSLMAGKYVVSKTGLYLWSIPSALADILIALAMLSLLRWATGNFSNFVLVRVVRLTIETNALTAASAIAILVLYAVFPDELYYVYLTEIIGKLYSNTLLVSLNNRIYFREHQPPEHDDGASSLTVSDRRDRATASLSLSFAVPEQQTQASKSVIFPVYPISRSANLDYSSTDLSSPHLTTLTPPEDLEWTAGTSPGLNGRKDEFSG